MRRPLLLTAFLACATGAMAQDIPTLDAQESGIPSEPFYASIMIANSSGFHDLFLSRGASWGTEATVDKYGLPIAYDSESKAISFYD